MTKDKPTRELTHALPTPAKVTLKDRYSRTRATFTLEESPAPLPIITQSGHYYETATGTRFLIYAGTGALEWQDATACYDFSQEAKNAATLREFDTALREKSARANAFSQAYSRNIENKGYRSAQGDVSLEKNALYISPLGYSAIDSYLSTGRAKGGEDA